MRDEGENSADQRFIYSYFILSPSSFNPSLSYAANRLSEKLDSNHANTSANTNAGAAVIIGQAMSAMPNRQYGACDGTIAACTAAPTASRKAPIATASAACPAVVSGRELSQYRSYKMWQMNTTPLTAQAASRQRRTWDDGKPKTMPPLRMAGSQLPPAKQRSIF